MFSASSRDFHVSSAAAISTATLQQRSSADSMTLPFSSFSKYRMRKISRALSGQELLTVGRLNRVNMGAFISPFHVHFLVNLLKHGIHGIHGIILRLFP